VDPDAFIRDLAREALDNCPRKHWRAAWPAQGRGRDPPPSTRMHKLPYVIDNDRHRLADVLNQVLDDHRDLAMDIASAFFNLRGYQQLRERLQRLGSLRLLLGAEPLSGEDLGLKPRLDALQAALRGDLGAEPFRPETLALVEDLVRFLRDERVQVRLYERGFLHAKCYLFYGTPRRGPLFERFRPVLGIVGSSNFTGPGLTTNRELNLVHKGLLPEEEVDDQHARQAALSHYDDAPPDDRTQLADAYDGGTAPRVSGRISFESRRLLKSEVGAAAIWELAEWFDRQWADGRDFKQDLIDLLDASKFGTREYTPYQVYLKALFEYFRADLGAAGGVPADLYSLNLAEFQADAVERARRILSRYDGVMICDSVGLGKTWIGLQLLLDYAYHRRWHALIVCPASLRTMWQTRLDQTKIQAKILGQEVLGRQDFDVEPYGKYDVILIDESHNFRNKASGRYENLSRLIGLNGGRGEQGYRKKVILLTATPINNSVLDLYQQVQFLTRGDNAFFAGAGIGRLDKYFLTARRALLRGDGSTSRALANLLEEVVIRRTRQFIKKTYPDATIDGKKVHFPKRKLLTVRYDLEGTYGKIYDKIVRNIEDLKLAPYDLETYKADPAQRDPLLVGRGQALVGIFKSRYLKRFESSVAAFRISVFRLMEYLLTFRHYILAGVLLEPTDFWKLLGTIEQDLEDDARSQEEEEEEEDDNLARRPRSRHADIEANPKAAALLRKAERLPPETYHLQQLSDGLDGDLSALETVYDLIRPIKPEADKKLQRLRDMLVDELDGKKVLIFTSYRDTAEYLDRWIAQDKAFAARLGGRKVRTLHGGTKADTRTSLVQAFAPKSNERPEWAGTPREVDILISTDVLSEGQNLQDCAHLVNYDLHWNPTRMIQRAGRIDRIGTEFNTLFIHNFFPDAGLERLLGLVQSLQDKIRQIDATVGLDASVLGEAINPKVFNTIKRIEGQDESVLDEVESEAELASDEGLVRHLADFVRTSGADVLSQLPDGIHSGMHRPGRRGVFFYYQRRGQTPADTDHYWRYIDAATGDVEDNRLALAELIRCGPDEPRLVDPALKAQIHTLMAAVEEQIIETTREHEAVKTAPRELSADQSAVLVVLQQALHGGGVERRRLTALLGRLSLPLLAAPVKELKQALATYRRDGDTPAFVAACEQVSARYVPAPAPPADTGHPGVRPALRREDLRLICFEFIH
jgi:superfamily II DNA or RNA helicase